MAVPESFPASDGQQPGSRSLPQAQSLPQAAPLNQASAAKPQPTRAQPLKSEPLKPGGARPVVVAKDGSATGIQQRVEDAEMEVDVAEAALRNAPPWLVSAAVHMVLLIILALLVVATQGDHQIFLQSTPTEDEDISELFSHELEMNNPLGNDETADEIDPSFTPDHLPEVPDPLAAPPQSEIDPTADTTQSEITAVTPGIAFMGRNPGMKRALGNRYGSTGGTRKALDDGLGWLIKNQHADGSWSLVGPYSKGARSENRAAATAMALLAFQGDGHTHLEGKHKKVVAKGWAWLSKQQDELGNFFTEGSYHQRFYTNGQCAIAICELYGMSKDQKYREPAERAISYLLKSQGPAGAWRYDPNEGADVSVTGWIVMALQSAMMAGLKVPEENLEQIRQYLDTVGEQNGSRYPYQEGQQPTLSMTAEGLLCRQYLGWKQSDERLINGVEWLTQPENLIDYKKDPNVYYWYYATQVLRHMEGVYWKRWNNVMREALPSNQVKSSRNRREAGSWEPNMDDVHESKGGRLFTTCLSIYMLESYWRHMPKYSNIHLELLKNVGGK